jgi:small subunit ribosomal protein S9
VTEAETKTEAATNEAPPAFYPGLGRRKTAIARVRLKPNGSRQITINRKRNLEQYFQREADRAMAISPLEITGATKKFDISMNLCGGGMAGQAGAAKLGIARALSKAGAEYMTTLKQQGFLTRDAREKERRKYGHRGARASYQFSKR